MNIVSMVVILTPSVPPIIRAMFTVPNVALRNTMACRVYRLLKLGVIRDDTEVTMRSENFKLPYISRRRNTSDSAPARKTSRMDNSSVSASTTIHTMGHEDKIVGILPMHITINTDIETDDRSSDQTKANRLTYTQVV